MRADFPRLTATAAAVPEPTKKSATRSPGLEEASKMRSIRFLCFITNAFFLHLYQFSVCVVLTLVCRIRSVVAAYYGMPSMLLRQIGKRVRERRESLGLSQEELAHKSGCHRTYIGMIERAEKSVGVERLAQISRALEMSVSELLRGFG